MRREQHGGLLPPVEGAPEAGDSLFIERARRLVEDEQRWIAQERSCQRELLQHSGRASIPTLAQDLVQLELLRETLDRPRCGTAAEPAQPSVEQKVRPARETQIERALL